VSQGEIARMLNGGVFTQQALENFCGSASVRTKLLSLVKKDLGIVREKTSIMGNSNQFLYKLERNKITFDDVDENSALSLGAYYLRESLGFLLSGITPIHDPISPAKFRGFLPLGLDSENRTHYIDLRFSYFNEQSINILDFTNVDETAVQLLLFENSRVFNAFQHGVRAKDLEEKFKNQIWIILEGDDEFSSRGNIATIFANRIVVSDRESLITAFDKSVIQTTKDKFYESIEANYKKGVENAERFKAAMKKGKQRKASE